MVAVLLRPLLHLLPLLFLQVTFRHCDGGTTLPLSLGIQELPDVPDRLHGLVNVYKSIIFDSFTLARSFLLRTGIGLELDMANLHCEPVLAVEMLLEVTTGPGELGTQRALVEPEAEVVVDVALHQGQLGAAVATRLLQGPWSGDRSEGDWGCKVGSLEFPMSSHENNFSNDKCAWFLPWPRR